MKKIMKTLSLMFAVGAMLFGSGLHHEETKVARAAETTATLSFADKAQRTSFSTTKQVWEQNGITFTNNKSSSTNNVADYAKPVRLYANSSIEVKIDSGDITKIVFDANSDSYATALKNSIGTTATVSSDKVTVITNNNPFTVTKLTAQVRLDSITVTYNESTGGDTGVTDEEKIAAVENAIAAIGEVSNTAASKKLIDDARNAYDDLDAELQSSVSNYQDLLDAEATYKSLVNQSAADAVIALLEDLPEANEITDYSKASEIKAARNAYDKLIPEQKNLIPDQLVDKLEAAEAKLEEYKPLMYEINTNGTLNSGSSELSSTEKLEEAYPTPDGISWTGTPSKAYGKFNTDALKLGTGKVAGYVELKLDSEEYYITEVIISANRYDSGTKLVITAGNLTVESGALAEGSNEYSFDVASAKSSTIRISTSPLRAYITGISVLYAKHTSNIDQAKVDEVIEIINNIGTPTASLTFKKDLEDAEAAFEALTPAEQEVVTNSSILTSARETFDSLVTSSTTFKGINQSYDATKIEIGGLTLNTNVSGNYNSIGYNDKAKEKAIADENIAEALEIDSTTTGVVTLHTYFYDGFFSLDLLANDAIKGTVYYLGSADGGITYSVISSEELNVTSGNPIDLDVSTSGITDLVIAFVSTQEAQRMILSSVTYYSKANAENADFLLEYLTSLDTCTEYSEVIEVREYYESLSDYEKIVFSRSNIVDNDEDGNEIVVNAMDKLEYMEAWKAWKDANPDNENLGSNLLTNLTSSNNTIFVLIVGLLGLTSILGYYFLNKKKYSC